MKSGKLLLAALSLCVWLGALSPLTAQADQHHRHKVCHYDHHHHRTCHWVN
ncbi:HHHH-motif protein [Paraburkholderia solitsugae]|uniref:HHHH-motif protein n=1 Tax=Paraburkholderia solitsugae TaxID=2675748 RepID=UPI001F3F396C|nr:HHHH-motif protein [Paraburkholderia solitsugae]